MRERISKLLSVKSIVTILLTVVFVIQVLRCLPIPQELQTIFNVVIGFYFGTQKVKE